MRHGRSIRLIALLAALAASATIAPSALADIGGGDTSTPPITDDSSSGSSTSTPPATTDTPPSTTTPPATTTPPPTTSVPEEGDVVVPTTPRVPADSAPGGGGQLPFTGPGDVLLASLLALLACSGGMLLMAGASGRDELDQLYRRTMDSPSPFALAYRELRRQQVD